MDVGPDRNAERGPEAFGTSGSLSQLVQLLKICFYSFSLIRFPYIKEYRMRNWKNQDLNLRSLQCIVD